MKNESTKSIILSNIPNFLTIARIVMTFVVMYAIFVDYHIVTIVILFGVAASTDFFDGRLARKYRWESEFGRKADMIADRFLWIGTAIAFIIVFGRQDFLKGYHGLQLLLIMSREVITAPFSLIAFFSGNSLPPARYIAKVTTFLQGFALPCLILSISYPWFLLASVPLSLAIGITGFLSAMHYIRDIQPKSKKKPKR